MTHSAPNALELALKARIPMIGITSDDPVNEWAILQRLSGMVPAIAIKNIKIMGDRLYIATDESLLTTDNYLQLEKNESVMVFVNLTKPSSLVFDAGALEAPPGMMAEKVLAHLDASDHPPLLSALNGLSIKAAKETIALTAVRTGEVSANEVRRTRAVMLQHTVHGLSVVDTSFDFYDVPKGIAQWMTMSLPYLNHPQLAPRGLLLVGKTGVGKTTAPKYIAKSLNLPLYRLDIADALDKWTGVSEHRVSRALQIVDRESPAVLLIDEVEKIFGGQNEAVERILSQLLWWLAEHRTQVITIMTTNNISKLPQELYRPGRVDQVIHLRGLGRVQAFEFALEVLATLPLNLESSIQDAIHAEIHDAYDGGTITDISHAEIRQVVIDFVRRKGLVSS